MGSPFCRPRTGSLDAAGAPLGDGSNSPAREISTFPQQTTDENLARSLKIPRYVHWSHLSSLSNSSAARATVLIPLIGYLILFNEKMVDYLNLIGVLNGGDMHNGVSFRLLSLYMGLCFIAAAVMVYALRCPSEITGFSTAPQFIAHVQGTMSGPSIRNIEVVLGNEPTMQDEFEGVRIVRRMEVKANDDEYIRGLLQLYFDYLNESREFSRLVCILFYALGFAFASMPSAKIFLKISGIFFGLLWQAVTGTM